MPTYDYECEKCGYNFEKIHNMNYNKIVYCKRCSGNSKKVISKGVDIIFKGSGFYVNDYKEVKK